VTAGAIFFSICSARQRKSGLGLEAQRDAVRSYLNGGQWSSLVAEFTEVESGKKDDRPELAKALQAYRIYGAELVIAKLDRLSRDAHFLLGMEKAGVDSVAADMPHANRLTVGIMAMVADEERADHLGANQSRVGGGQELGGDRGAGYHVQRGGLAAMHRSPALMNGQRTSPTSSKICVMLRWIPSAASNGL
jgi:DNA invertase Pin-like site-specific DNA recombinase